LTLEIKRELPTCHLDILCVWNTDHRKRWSWPFKSMDIMKFITRPIDVLFERVDNQGMEFLEVSNETGFELIKVKIGPKSSHPLLVLVEADSMEQDRRLKDMHIGVMEAIIDLQAVMLAIKILELFVCT